MKRPLRTHIPGLFLILLLTVGILAGGQLHNGFSFQERSLVAFVKSGGQAESICGDVSHPEATAALCDICCLVDGAVPPGHHAQTVRLPYLNIRKAAMAGPVNTKPAPRNPGWGVRAPPRRLS